MLPIILMLMIHFNIMQYNYAEEYEINANRRLHSTWRWRWTLVNARGELRPVWIQCLISSAVKVLDNKIMRQWEYYTIKCLDMNTLCDKKHEQKQLVGYGPTIVVAICWCLPAGVCQKRVHHFLSWMCLVSAMVGGSSFRIFAIGLGKKNQYAPEIYIVWRRGQE